MADVKFEIPSAPSCLPEAEQSKWKKAYADEYKSAINDHADGPESKAAQDHAHSQALKISNRMLRTPEFANAEEALKAPQHHFLQREDDGKGTLRCVTIDGKKYSFKAPVAKKQETKQSPPAA